MWASEPIYWQMMNLQKKPLSRTRLRFALTLGLAIASLGSTAAASESVSRMYAWTDPATGHSQLSGYPPPFYRSNAPNMPRVRVWAGGRLVDDTGFEVSSALARLLREEAFSAPAVGTGATSMAAIGEDASGTSETETNAANAAGDPALAGEQSTQVDAAGNASDPATGSVVATLKALISAWDAANAVRAKEVLDAADGTASSKAQETGPAPLPP